MTQPRARLNRFDRAKATRQARGPSLAEMIHEAANRPNKIEPRRRRAPVAEVTPPRVARQKVSTPEERVTHGGVASASVTRPQQVKPEPAKAPPQWWEEQLGWRSRGVQPPEPCDVRYETIHDYDPIEYFLREQDDDRED